jgi:methyl-accepting chemotaxis protein
MADFFRLLAFFWNNRQQLLSLLENLAPALQAAGDSMEAASEGAIEASRYIRGNGTGGLNARSVFISGANAIENVKSQISDVKSQIDTLADNPFFYAVRLPMQEFATRVDDVSDQIQAIADSLDDVSDALDSAGLHLKNLGQGLGSAGNQFKQLS